jgi:predicted cobalt transporter CbtA
MKEGRSRLVRISEASAMICGFGTCLALVICLLQPIMDWQKGVLRTFANYAGMSVAMTVPFLVGFLISAYCVRKFSR